MQVDEAKTIPLKYMLDKDFTKNFFKSTLLTSFPELTGDTRKDFFTEYINRVKAQTEPVGKTGRIVRLIICLTSGLGRILPGVRRWNTSVRGKNKGCLVQFSNG